MLWDSLLLTFIFDSDSFRLFGLVWKYEFVIWMFQVVDLQIFAQPRITLKPLVPSFPCFAKIFVSLMEKVRDGIFKNQL